MEVQKIGINFIKMIPKELFFLEENQWPNHFMLTNFMRP